MGASRRSSRWFFEPKIFFKIQLTIELVISMRLSEPQWLAASRGGIGWFFHLVEKRQRLLRGETNAFVHPDGYKAYLSESEKDFRDKVAKQETQSQ